MTRILHLSDLHFWHLPKRPSMWLSKRASTYLALLMQSHRRFKLVRMEQLLKIIPELNLSHAVISGDLTLSGTDHEFEMFHAFYQQLKKMVPHICVVPGNHDLYIKRKWKKGFYKHALQWMDEVTLQGLFEKRQSTVTLDGVEFILLDLARPCPLGHAEGLFSHEQALELKKAVEKPTHISRVVVGHYPMHPTKKRANQLEGFEKLEETLRAQNVTAYLHGHTHQQHLIDERYFGLPVSMDSGSLSGPLQAGFNILDIQENMSHAYMYHYDSLHGWQMHQELLWRMNSMEVATETLML
jgi:3',5'-cyclic AMP phosphodiesterase CpdA